jgi:hypothetical protein
MILLPIRYKVINRYDKVYPCMMTQLDPGISMH